MIIVPFEEVCVDDIYRVPKYYEELERAVNQTVSHCYFTLLYWMEDQPTERLLPAAK